MTVKELIEINQKIVDICIEVRVEGTRLYDYLGIGLASGVKPPYPMKVPKSRKYIGNMSVETKKEGQYIDKSINAWDDGKDYWQIKIDRIPKKWLELEVYSWKGERAYRGVTRSRGSEEAERIRIVALPSGEDIPSEEEEKPKQNEQIEGQTDIFDFIKEE